MKRRTLLVAGAVLVSRDRRQTIVRLGVGAAVGGVVLVVAYGITRSWAVGHVESPEGRAAAGAVWDAFLADLRNAAQQAVKARLLLDAIADAEELSVTDDELSERIIYQAQRHGVSPNEYVKQVQEAGELGGMYADIRRGKALATVVRQATVTDAAGNSVDIEALVSSATPQRAESAGSPSLDDAGGNPA